MVKSTEARGNTSAEEVCHLAVLLEQGNNPVRGSETDLALKTPQDIG